MSRDGTRVLVDQQRLTGAGLGKSDVAVVTMATGAVVNLRIPTFTPGAWGGEQASAPRPSPALSRSTSTRTDGTSEPDNRIVR